MSTADSRQALNNRANRIAFDRDRRQEGRAPKLATAVTSGSSAIPDSELKPSSTGAGSTAVKKPYLWGSHRAPNPSSISTQKSSDETIAREHSSNSESVSSSVDTGSENVRKPYILRKHRTPSASSSVSVLQPSAETTGMTLTKEQQEQQDEQDEQDLFGEDYDRAAARRRGTRPLTQSELESKNVDELESYAIHRSEDVTQNIEDCRRVAEETVGIASSTMENLHYQGGQVKRVHHRAASVESDLIVGEKLLGKLGGIFSRTWKPKKGDKIKGPQTLTDFDKRKTKQSERSAVLSDTHKNLNFPSNDAQARINRYAGLTQTQVQLEMERERQDEGLDSLDDVVNHLKNMSKDIQEEAEKQTAAMGQFEHDVDTIHDRVKQSYNRTRIITGR